MNDIPKSVYSVQPFNMFVTCVSFIRGNPVYIHLMNPKLLAKNRLPPLLLAALLLGGINPSMARQSDLEKPIDIRADSSEFDEKAGVQTLSGNVQITQGTLQISADFIAITLKDNALSKIEGRGSPIVFKQENEAGDPMRGEAREIVYDANTGTLVLKGAASLSQPRQSLTSERITFNAQTQKVSAEGDGNESRVSIQIQPPSKR